MSGGRGQAAVLALASVSLLTLTDITLSKNLLS